MNHWKPKDPIVIRAAQRSDFRKELEHLLNRHSMENDSNTPDFLLAEFLYGCLRAFDKAVSERDRWYGVRHRPGESK